MSDQEDVSKSQDNDEKAVQQDVDKLAPLNVGKPSEGKEGVQTTAAKVPVDLLRDICPSIRDYIGGYISLADAKAGVLIGVFSGLLSVAITKGREIFSIAPQQWGLWEFVCVISWVLLAGAIVCALFVVWPKTTTSQKVGFVSWVHIANYRKIEDYLTNMLATNSSRIVTQMCELNYDLARVCRRKYFWLSLCFKAGAFGAILLALFLIEKYF